MHLSSFIGGAVILAAIVTVGILTSTDWRTASRESAGIAPLPAQESRAVVQVYGARAINWRGWFSLHCWVAVKEKGAGHYTTYQVAGWNLRRGGGSVMAQDDVPDRAWFGAKPHLIESLVGEEAEAAIPKIRAAVASYPYPQAYRIWPGPNSNTFVSHVVRAVPELGVELPANAIGRDWLGQGDFFARSESGTGYQISLFGVLGATAGIADGVEVNILGFSFGVDVLRPALKLPFIGRIGMTDAPYRP